MPDVFDQNRPDGDKPLNLNDDELQENNRVLVTSIGKEHDFAQGGDQSGAHKFGVGAGGVRDASGPAEGSIWINDEDDPATGAGAGLTGEKKFAIDFYDGAAWQTVKPSYPDQTTQHTKGQYGTYTDLTSSSNLIDWNWNDGNAFKHNMTEHTTLKNPLGEMNSTTDKFMSVMLWVKQHASPPTDGYTLDFQAKFAGAFDGRILPIDGSASAITLIYFTLLPNDFILVNVIPGITELV